MNSNIPRRPSRFLAGGAILALAVTCGGTTPATTVVTPAATPVVTAPPLTAAAPTATAAAPTASPAQAQVASHKVGTKHAQQPKRLEAVVEIDMYDHYFASPEGVKNPTFTLPVGKTIGLHFHNEGTEMHEFEIGRTLKQGGGYEKSLFDLVKADVFFYYGTVKAEVGGATFEEIEMDAGLKDVWIRLIVPAELKGEWEIGCFAPEHYEKGMHAKLSFQ